MGKTSIEWTDASWNPIVGCTEISPGCANCYAARLAATRLKNTPQYKGLAGTDGFPLPGESATPRVRPIWTGEVRFLPERLQEPLHWRAPRRIFVCDMGDLFHERVEDEWIEKVFDTIYKCPQHTFQILTKRADRMLAWFQKEWTVAGVLDPPLPNVWLGVSVENQHFADERIPLLLATPAAVRWISAEPLLGPVDLNISILRWAVIDTPESREFNRRVGMGLDWVVAGGESGPNARPMHPDWARSLRDQCQAAGVPFFFKQWGQWSPNGQARAGAKRRYTITHLNSLSFDGVGKKSAGRLLDGQEWNEFPR